MAQPLDRCRPLWEMWLFEGADADRWGLICKLHHCMVDGIAAGDLLGVLLSPEPGTAPTVRDDWQPRPEPSSASVLAQTLEQIHASGPATASANGPCARGRARVIRHGGRHPTGGLVSLRGPVRHAHRALAQPAAARRAPVGPGARPASGRQDDPPGAGGYRQRRRARGVAAPFASCYSSAAKPVPDELVVRTLVPLSVRTPDARGIPDNRVSALFAATAHRP